MRLINTVGGVMVILAMNEARHPGGAPHLHVDLPGFVGVDITTYSSSTCGAWAFVPGA